MPFALARGRRALEDAIAQFRAAPDELAAETRARTLLLLVKQGANGLNLTGPTTSSLPDSLKIMMLSAGLHASMPELGKEVMTSFNKTQSTCSCLYAHSAAASLGLLFAASISPPFP